jgi:hypothetical protein
MPRGTRHTLTGTLGWNERNRIHVLNMEGGGYWFVDMPGRARHLIGREVTIEGVRSGFNLLDVHRLLAIDGAPVKSRFEAVVTLLRERLSLVTSY